MNYSIFDTIVFQKSGNLKMHRLGICALQTLLILLKTEKARRKKGDVIIWSDNMWQGDHENCSHSLVSSLNFGTKVKKFVDSI